MNKQYLQINQKLWNAKTPVHLASDFYEMEAFLKGKNSLKSIELDLLGDLSGKKILHLQCHFGQDSLSLARMGAKVTGADLSNEAIKKAKELNQQLGLDAQFICCDIFELDQHLNEQFDIVFTSYGVITWLPDLKPWGRLIQHFLKPGGQFIMAEFHPFVWMFNEKLTSVDYDYFNTGPIIEVETGSYADPEANISNEAYYWNHSMADTISALIHAGLSLKGFQEYDFSPYDLFGEGIPVKNGFQVKGMEGKIPLIFSVVAE